MPADAISRMDSSSDTGGSSSNNGANNGSDNESPHMQLGSSPGAASIASSSNESRERNDSEGSDRQPRFVLPGTAGSPPKILTIDEVQHALTNLDNMQLAHEIAVNPDFRLRQHQPADNTLERNIKDMVHRAFWAAIREQLAEEPPCYDHAIQLLADIKAGFGHIISSNNSRALERICEVLDAQVIRQQAEQGVLDFGSYATFCIQIMARSCAPVRDEAVAKLSDIGDVLDQFRGILEVMELMKLDMANCLIESARKVVMTHSIEYEKERFREYLDVYTGSFPATEAWLLRHRQQQPQAARADGTVPQAGSTEGAILAAYVELLQLNRDGRAFPETVLMDRERIDVLAVRTLRLCINAAVLVLCASLPAVASHAGYRAQIKQQCAILLEAVDTEAALPETLEGVWLQMRGVLRAAATETGGAPMDATTEQQLHTQICLLADEGSPVRTVMNRRLMSYASLMVMRAQATPPPPPGFTDFADELDLFVAFRRITVYNYMVFGEFYHKVLNGETNTAAETTTSATVAASASEASLTINGTESSQ